MLKDCKELRKLLLENPSLPLLCFATEEANIREYSVELASCHCEKGEVLDLEQSDDLPWRPYKDRVYTDRDDLEEDIIDALTDEFASYSDEEFDTLIKERIADLEPFWRECIILTVDSYRE